MTEEQRSRRPIFIATPEFEFDLGNEGDRRQDDQGSVDLGSKWGQYHRLRHICNACFYIGLNKEVLGRIVAMLTRLVDCFGTDEIHPRACMGIESGLRPNAPCPERAKEFGPGFNRFNPISAKIMRGASMDEWSLSRRDSTIVAWHEAPGKASLERTVPSGTV